MSRSGWVVWQKGKASVTEVCHNVGPNDFVAEVDGKKIGSYPTLERAKTYAEYMLRAPKGPSPAVPSIPAELRTLSMFTGQTDLESGQSRDGTFGDVIPKRPKRPRAPKWEPRGLSAWVRCYVSGPKKGNERDRIERTSDGKYVASCDGTRVGVYPTLEKACAAVEALA